MGAKANDLHTQAHAPYPLLGNTKRKAAVPGSELANTFKQLLALS